MPVLRINQQRGDAPHRYRIEITATDIPNFGTLQFSRDIAFELTPQDGERIRWYLEDYLQFDEEPGAANRQRGRSVHGRMRRRVVPQPV